MKNNQKNTESAENIVNFQNDLAQKIEKQKELLSNLQNLFRHREIFSDILEKVQTFKEEILKDNANFDTSNFKITFSQKSEMRTIFEFQIGNVFLIDEFLNLFEGKTIAKILELDTNIAKLTEV